MWFIRTSSVFLTWFVCDISVKISRRDRNFSPLFHLFSRMQKMHSGGVTDTAFLLHQFEVYHPVERLKNRKDT